MSGLLLLVTVRALLMSPKGRNASRDSLVLNWLGGIIIIVSLHINFNKLLMPFSLVAALPIRCKVYNFHLRL